MNSVHGGPIERSRRTAEAKRHPRRRGAARIIELQKTNMVRGLALLARSDPRPNYLTPENNDGIPRLVRSDPLPPAARNPEAQTSRRPDTPRQEGIALRPRPSVCPL